MDTVRVPGRGARVGSGAILQRRDPRRGVQTPERGDPNWSGKTTAQTRGPSCGGPRNKGSEPWTGETTEERASRTMRDPERGWGRMGEGTTPGSPLAAGPCAPSAPWRGAVAAPAQAARGCERAGRGKGSR